MPSLARYYLTGSFNDWRPFDPQFQFTPVVSPYGRDACGVEHPDRVVTSGYSLETTLPTGPLAFKIVSTATPDRPWSIAEKKDDPRPYLISEAQFETRHGMRPHCIVEHATREGPAAELLNTSQRQRWDFHPRSQTLTVHDQFHRSQGVELRPWRSFDCEDHSFDSWIALPYAYDPESAFRYPVWYVFDGRCLLYGENPWRGQWNESGRQFPQLLDTLARHGSVSPAIVVGLGVPGIPPQRRKTYWRQTSWLHKAFVQTLRRQVLTALQDEFPASPSATQRFLMGLSNGGDMSLAVLARASEEFRGALALSPEGADGMIARFENLSDKQRGRLHVAISYAEHEPHPSFQTTAVQAARRLQAMKIDTLLHYLPAISHTDPTIFNHVAACIHFLMQR